MASPEFDLIDRWFSACGTERDDVCLGVGDDAALLTPRADSQLVVTQDTLVEGVHFFPGTDPQSLGHKCLAVNLSDLAAMGAEPAWVTLSLTLPDIDPNWLDEFSRGFCALAAAHAVRLIGGDTTRGPLALSVTALGWVDREQALRRSGARPGDLICVSGTLGDAGLALRLSDGRSIAGVSPELRARLERPQPRLALGLALRSLAHCAIDVSDGLAADLGHLLAASGVGATVELARLPCTPVVRQYLADTGDWGLLLGAGDDYELCFTMPAERREELAAVERSSGCAIAVVGAITGETGMRFVAADGGEYRLSRCGYDHFSGMEPA